MYGFKFTPEDINKLIAELKETFEIDYSDFTRSAFLHGLSVFMSSHALRSIDELIFRIRKENFFGEMLIKDLAGSESEAFRDSLVWRIIRFDVIKDLYEKNEGKIRIWVPGCTTGEELYSLSILLRENFFIEKVELLASSISNKCTEQIKSGFFSIKKCEINQANYLRCKGKSDFKNYYSISGNKAQWDTRLIDNVQFLPPRVVFNNPPKNIHFIFYRNRMLYFNYDLQLKLLNSFHNCLTNDGFLVMGTKETLLNFDLKSKFSTVNEKESVYRKIAVASL